MIEVERGTPDRPPQAGVGKRVAIGAAWFIAMRWIVRLIGLVSTIVLARILVPDDFGLVAIATSYIALLDAFSDLGTRTALVRHDTLEPRFMDTVFTVQAIRGIAIGTIVFGSAWLFPIAIGDERLRAVVWVLALQPVIAGLLNPAIIKFERQMDFRRELIVQVVAKLAATSTAIAGAVIYQSYWAMVAGLLVEATCRVTISYVLAPFRPRLGLDRWRELFRFSGWLSGASFLDALVDRLDTILIGAFLDVRIAGFYSVGKQLAVMPMGEVLPAANRALFPGLLHFKDDIEKLSRNVMLAFAGMTMLSMPIAVGFCLVAGDFVRLVYGEKWLEAVSIIQVISLCVGVEVVGGSVATSAAMALSQTKMLFLRSAARVLIRVPIFVLGLWLFGLEGALAGYLLGSVVFAVSNVSILHKLLSVRLTSIVDCLWPPLLGTAAMAGAMLQVAEFLAPLQTSLPNMIGILALKIALGAGIYGTVQIVLWKVTGRPNLDFILKRRTKT